MTDLKPISHASAGALLSQQIGGALPLLADESLWYASVDGNLLGAAVRSITGTWRFALLRRDAQGCYQKLAMGDGYTLPFDAINALMERHEAA